MNLPLCWCAGWLAGSVFLFAFRAPFSVFFASVFLLGNCRMEKERGARNQHANHQCCSFFGENCLLFLLSAKTTDVCTFHTHTTLTHDTKSTHHSSFASKHKCFFASSQREWSVLQRNSSPPSLPRWELPAPQECLGPNPLFEKKPKTSTRGCFSCGCQSLFWCCAGASHRRQALATFSIVFSAILKPRRSRR